MNPNLAEAKRLMENGGYTCVLYKDGITHTSTKRGVLPLKEWLEKKTELKGFSAADKVVGKAAAFPVCPHGCPGGICPRDERGRGPGFRGSRYRSLL